MLNETPFADVQATPDGFSIPELKWRELLFTGALRADGDFYVRDPARPLAPFALADPFPAGVRLRVRREGGRVVVVRADAVNAPRAEPGAAFELARAAEISARRTRTNGSHGDTEDTENGDGCPPADPRASDSRL